MRWSPGFQSATIARGSLVTPVWRPNTKVVSTTASDSAKALSTAPTSSLRSKQRLSPSDGMDHRRLGIERGFRIGDRGQFLVVDLDQFAGVLGFGAAARDHGADRFALPAGTLDCDRRLRRRFQALQMREHADPRRHDLGEFRAGDHGDHAGRFLGGVGGNRSLMRAWACGERTKATCAMRGSVTSLTYWPRPCVSRARLGRGTERPM